MSLTIRGVTCSPTDGLYAENAPVKLPVKICLVVHKRMYSQEFGSACGPVIVPVFKTGGRQVTLSLVGSTPTRFRQYLSMT